MLTVHHLGLSQSERIVWLCEELGLDHELRRYDRDPVTRMAPPEYKALHPFGTAPVITDGEVVMGESGAIADYILGRYGGGRLAVAPDSPNFPDYLYWFHFANGSLMPAAMIKLIAERVSGGASSDGARALGGRLDTAYRLSEQRLAAADYFGGPEFTAADIMMVFAFTTMRHFAPRDLAPYPAIRAYLQRIGARPAYQRAMSRADPGDPPLLT